MEGSKEGNNDTGDILKSASAREFFADYSPLFRIQPVPFLAWLYSLIFRKKRGATFLATMDNMHSWHTDNWWAQKFKQKQETRLMKRRHRYIGSKVASHLTSWDATSLPPRAQSCCYCEMWPNIAVMFRHVIACNYFVCSFFPRSIDADEIGQPLNCNLG